MHCVPAHVHARALLPALLPGSCQGAAAFTTTTNLTMSLSVAGLGPRFKVCVCVGVREGGLL